MCKLIAILYRLQWVNTVQDHYNTANCNATQKTPRRLPMWVALDSVNCQITHERHPYLWLSFESYTRDRSFTFEFVVLCAIFCYIVPRYIKSLYQKDIKYYILSKTSKQNCLHICRSNPYVMKDGPLPLLTMSSITRSLTESNGLFV